jgi:hypothetical protein
MASDAAVVASTATQIGVLDVIRHALSHGRGPAEAGGGI